MSKNSEKYTLKNFVGKKFGNVVVEDFDKINNHGEKCWKCRCDCGNYTFLTTNQLVKGYTKRCRKCGFKITGEKNSKPPKFSKRLYGCYVNMKTRVTNKKQDDYNRYINRGISMCSEWLNDYYSFEKWALENGYDENLTLDRIDNNGNYEPSNCRWVDRKTQANNRRTNVILEYNGEKDTMANWSKKLKIPYYYFQKNHKTKNMEEMVNGYNYRSRYQRKNIKT